MENKLSWPKHSVSDLEHEFVPGDIVEWIRIGNEHRLKTTTTTYVGIVMNKSGSGRIHIKVKIPCSVGHYWTSRVTVPKNLRKITLDEIKARALNN